MGLPACFAAVTPTESDRSPIRLHPSRRARLAATTRPNSATRSSVRGCAPSPAQYSLSYWSDASGSLIGVGHVSANIVAVQMASRGERACLRLADGRDIGV